MIDQTNYGDFITNLKASLKLGSDVHACVFPLCFEKTC